MADIKLIAGLADRYKNFFNAAGVVAAALGGVYLGIARSNIEARYLIKEVAVNARQDNNELRMTVDRFVNSVDRQMAICNHPGPKGPSFNGPQHIADRHPARPKTSSDRNLWSTDKDFPPYAPHARQLRTECWCR